MRAVDPVPGLKDQVAKAVVDRLEGWTQVYAAHLVGTDQPRMSDLRNGRLARFSLEQLVRFAARIDLEIALRVTWTGRRAWLGRPKR